MHCRQVQDEQRKSLLHRLSVRDVLASVGCEQCERVQRLPCRYVLWCGGGERVHVLSEQHVFRGFGVVLPVVPGQLGVNGRQRVSGILLLQQRICACGGDIHVQGL